MRDYRVVILLALALAACKPASAPASHAPPAPQPSLAMQESFPNCTWGEVRASGVSIWSYTCPDQQLVADETLPGFARERDGQRYPVIQLFAKPADAPIEAALPAIRAASPGGEACVLEAFSGVEGGYQLVPTGEALVAYQAFTSGKSDQGPSLPCGPLGPSEVGARLIEIVAGAPDKVAVIDLGSDIQIFDAQTLRAAP